MWQQTIREATDKRPKNKQAAGGEIACDVGMSWTLNAL